MRYLLALFMFGVQGVPTSAQEQPEGGYNETRCFYANESFALGTPLLIGDAFLVCGATPVGPQWSVDANGKAANCLYKSDYYGAGSVLEVSKGNTIFCAADGKWQSQASKQ